MSATEDFDFDADRASPEGLCTWLDERIYEIFGQVEGSDVWRAVIKSGQTPIAIEILKEIYLEIVMYQPDSLEAAVASIAQMPRTMPVAWFDEMLRHQVEEFDHAEMALRDYKALGGDEGYARSRPQSPSAFAVAAVWRNIAHKRNPFMYLGAVYLFDALTPIVTAKAKEVMASTSQTHGGFEFINHHATADIEHAETVRKLILDVATRYPEQRSAITYGFEYFAHVYPLPVWTAAMSRVERSHSLKAKVA
jgi:hypothetical protein